MIFKPRKIFAMWDTWCWYHAGTYYAYYLTMGATKRQGWHGQGVALAVSDDGVHWKEIGVVIPKDRGATGLGSGAVWKAGDFEKTGRFIMNYSTWSDWCIESQRIRFAESKDLVHWRKIGAASEFKANPKWYKTWPKFGDARWDCIYPLLHRPGGGLYGYWTGLPKGKPGFGFGESLDGVHWRALPPPTVEGTGQGEVGAVECVDGTYYMLYHGGGLLLRADSPKGPFRPVKKNSEFLRGHAYFTRFFPTPDALLVNHHSMPRGDCMGEGRCRLAPLKKVVPDGHGSLRLAYWEGNEKLKDKPVRVAAGRKNKRTQFARLLDSEFDTAKGFVLEGTLPLDSVFPRKWPAVSGLDRFPDGKPMSGLYVEYEAGRGTCILCGPNGITEAGLTDSQGAFFKREFRVNRELSLGPSAPFRLLLKGSMLEFYVADILMLVYSLPEQATGRLGLIGRAGAAGVRTWRGWKF